MSDKEQATRWADALMDGDYSNAPQLAALLRRWPDGEPQSERIAALEAENAEWRAKASTWLASPEAASRLQGYRELTERIAALEAALAERDEVLEIARQALESHMAQTRVIQRSVDALRAIEEVKHD